MPRRLFVNASQVSRVQLVRTSANGDTVKPVREGELVSMEATANAPPWSGQEVHAKRDASVTQPMVDALRPCVPMRRPPTSVSNVNVMLDSQEVAFSVPRGGRGTRAQVCVGLTAPLLVKPVNANHFGQSPPAPSHAPKRWSKTEHITTAQRK